MIEHITAALLSTLLLGLVTNQATRIIHDGSLFDPMWGWLCGWYAAEDRRDDLRGYLYRGLTCRLCFGQWIAFLTTWAAVAVGWVVDPTALPQQEWLFLAIVGPFAVGGVDQLIEMFRREE